LEPRIGDSSFTGRILPFLQNGHLSTSTPVSLISLCFVISFSFDFSAYCSIMYKSNGGVADIHKDIVGNKLWFKLRKL